MQLRFMIGQDTHATRPIPLENGLRDTIFTCGRHDTREPRRHRRRAHGASGANSNDLKAEWPRITRSSFGDPKERIENPPRHTVQ